MSKKSRYLLIICGLLAFIILAPLMVLYVLGLSYDWENHRFIPTGILAVRTEPESVTILLDDKIVKHSSADIKFLIPKEYEIVIAKEGYFSWSKRLAVYQNQVTWANASGPKIVLFKNTQAIKSSTPNVTDFFIHDDQLFTLDKNSLTVTTLGRTDSTAHYPLAAGISRILPSKSGNYLLLLPPPGFLEPLLLVFDVKNKKIINLSSQVSKNFSAAFSQNDQLFVQSGGTLYKINLDNYQKIPVFKDVLSFTLEDEDIYYIRQTGKQTILATANVASLEEQPLVTNLSVFTQAQLFATNQKQIFLLADRVLYRVNSALERTIDNVEECMPAGSYDSLACLHAGELSVLNPGTQKFDLLTRSSSPLKSPVAREAYGHVFFVKNQEVISAELDTRNRQNQYVLYSGTDVEKIWIDPEAKELWILDGHQLFQKTIR